LNRALALRRVGRNVADIAAAARFYHEALGFQAIGEVVEDSGLAGMLGVERVRVLRMRLGTQEIELSECFPAGAGYPPHSQSNDQWFQHIAIVTADMAAAYARVMRHGAVPVSRNGPQRLPASSGGVVAFKFRDKEGHPLELLEFPPGGGGFWQRKSAGLTLGFDHSAISVGDVGQSVAFYARLGLSQTAATLNQGGEQERLDGLDAAKVDVAALEFEQLVPPHLELLHYCEPPGRPASGVNLNDIAADRLIFSAEGDECSMLRDPDGHVVVLEPVAQAAKDTGTPLGMMPDGFTRSREK
jgi:catechol 2,3-dioxygenase-like lactoylglutathione lyase family enzyme